MKKEKGERERGITFVPSVSPAIAPPHFLFLPSLSLSSSSLFLLLFYRQVGSATFLFYFSLDRQVGRATFHALPFPLTRHKFPSHKISPLSTPYSKDKMKKRLHFPFSHVRMKNLRQSSLPPYIFTKWMWVMWPMPTSFSLFISFYFFYLFGLLPFPPTHGYMCHSPNYSDLIVFIVL